jgi:hypothetical protein
MSENHELLFISSDIHANDIVSVDVNSFKTDDKFFETFSRPEDVHVCIPNIQFVLPLDQELYSSVLVILRTLFWHFNHKET